ncbi:MAG: hypothetical protein ACHQYQ_11940 [Bacteriovoracales bacterium]
MVIRMCPEVLKNLTTIEEKLTKLEEEEILKIIIFYLSLSK